MYKRQLDELRREGDLGNQQQYVAAPRQHLGDQVDVDFGLARPGDALQQGRGPVSYTHLDVYKRQAPPGAENFRQNGASSSSERGVRSNSELPAEPSPPPKPVSGAPPNPVTGTEFEPLALSS